MNVRSTFVELSIQLYLLVGKSFVNIGHLDSRSLHSRRSLSSQRTILHNTNMTGIMGKPISRNKGSAPSIIFRPSLWPRTWKYKSNTKNIDLSKSSTRQALYLYNKWSQGSFTRSGKVSFVWTTVSP